MPPRLAVSNIGRHTATLTLTDYTGSWYYQYTAPSGGTCSGEQTGTTAGVTSLTESTTYTFRAYSDSGCATVIATAASFTTPGKSLTWSNLAATKVTLTIAGHTGNWYYRSNRVQPTPANCTGPESNASINLTGLNMNTSYIYTAYSDSSCSTEIAATESFRTLRPALAASSVGATTATLTLSGWVPGTGTGKDGNWYFQADKAPHAANCEGPVSSGADALTGLSKNTRYTYKAYSDSGCDPNNELATASAFTTLAPALRAVQSGTVDVTLTLTNWANADGDWHFEDDQANSCSSNPVDAPTAPSTTSTHTATDVLQAIAPYVFTAYSHSSCISGSEIAVAPGFTPVKKLIATDVTATTATLTLGPHSGAWYYKHGNAGATCSAEISAGTSESALTGLTPNTTYTYTAYSDSSCTTKIVTASAFRTLNPTLAASSVSYTTATLTISRWDTSTDGNWYYQADQAPDDSCSGAQSALTDDLDSLTPNTTYTYTAYSDSGCSTAISAGSAFTTLPPALAASNVGGTTATLTIAGWTGNWYYQADKGTHTSCSSVQSTATANLTGLTVSTTYTYTAYSDSSCSTALATASAFTTLNTSLDVSNITTTGATLTISGHAGTWWYKADTGPHTNCSSAQSNATANLTGLTQGDSYTYTAYSDSSCTSANKIATASAFTTLNLAHTPGAFAVKLTLSGWTGGDWYHKAFGTGSACSTNAVTTDSVTITGLTKNTNKPRYSAYSDSGCTTLIVSRTGFFKTLDPSLTATKDPNNPRLGISLTLSGYSIAVDGPWWFRELEIVGSTPNPNPIDRCTSGGNSLTHTTTGLIPGDGYTVSAHRGDGANTCTDASKIPGLEVTNVILDYP